MSVTTDANKRKNEFIKATLMAIISGEWVPLAPALFSFIGNDSPYKDMINKVNTGKMKLSELNYYADDANRKTVDRTTARYAKKAMKYLEGGTR